MNIERKLELVRQQITSIATHDDAPATEVEAALRAVAKMVKGAADGLLVERAARAKQRGAQAKRAG
jgi:hypothetical protein